MQDAAAASVAIADDGELEDIRQLLADMDIGFQEGLCRGAAGSLLISTPDHAFEEDPQGSVLLSAAWSFHIVIAEKVTREIHRELKRGHCDFLVQRPVHPSALRLLILHALYSGAEERRTVRVAMGAGVKIRVGRRPRPATLVQLSARGCGLLCTHGIEERSRLCVIFPSELTGAQSFSVEGRVVASNPPKRDRRPGEHELAVVFRPPDADTRRLLRSMMSSNAVGSSLLHPRSSRALSSPAAATQGEATAPRTSTATLPASPGSLAERRVSARKQYRRSVIAARGGIAHTVIGRDLSTGGMRTAPDARFCLGGEFKLIIYGSARIPSFPVKAVVARDDGDAGCVLRFLDLSPQTSAELEKLVDELPVAARGDSGSGPHVVVSEIVEAE